MEFLDKMDEQVWAELEYRTRHQPIALYADQLSEAIGEDGLGQLALLLRTGTDTEVRAELDRIFDSYWSRQVRRVLENQQKIMTPLREILAARDAQH